MLKRIMVVGFAALDFGSTPTSQEPKPRPSTSSNAS